LKNSRKPGELSMGGEGFIKWDRRILKPRFISS